MKMNECALDSSTPNFIQIGLCTFRDEYSDTHTHNLLIKRPLKSLCEFSHGGEYEDDSLMGYSALSTITRLHGAVSQKAIILIHFVGTDS
jgi:hypothetical protein